MFNGLYPCFAKRARKDPLSRFAAYEHIGYAAGNADIVFQDHELAGRHADQIRARYRDIHVLANGKSPHLSPEMLTAIDHVPRDDAVGKDTALVINVLEKEIQSCDSLG